MKREFNSIIVDKKIIRHLPKDNSFNTRKIKKLYSNNLGMKPSNYFLSSYKNITVKVVLEPPPLGSKAIFFGGVVILRPEIFTRYLP